MTPFELDATPLPLPSPLAPALLPAESLPLLQPHTLEDALASYQRAVEIDPGLAKAWDEIGYYYDVVLDDEAAAHPYFRKAAELRRAGLPELRPTVVFVYGTLKRGHERHFALADQKFLGEARTLPRYRMVNLGSYPALTEGGASGIAGELWEVDAACVALLDKIEAVADAEYRRARVLLASPHEGVVAEAYFYCADVSALPDHGEVW